MRVGSEWVTSVIPWTCLIFCHVDVFAGSYVCWFCEMPCLGVRCIVCIMSLICSCFQASLISLFFLYMVRNMLCAAGE